MPSAGVQGVEMRPCLTCGVLSNGSRCDPCARKRRAKYGAAHVSERVRWVPVVALGAVDCHRCGERIEQHHEWELGHRVGQTSRPEHKSCNRRAGGHGA